MGSYIASDTCPLKNCFAVITLPQQEDPYVYLDSGVHSYQFMMPEWKLVDPIGQVHHVCCYRSALGNIWFKGFFDIRQFFYLSGNIWCLLQCTGDARFNISIYNGNGEEICYHRHVSTPVPTNSSAYDCYPCFFSCTLAKSHANASQMHLPKHVDEYIRNEGVVQWNFRDADGNKFPCLILTGPERIHSQFGRGWKSFCRAHKLKGGELITFCFSSKVSAIIDVVFHSKNK